MDNDIINNNNNSEQDELNMNNKNLPITVSDFSDTTVVKSVVSISDTKIEPPFLPNITKLIIHTGNILNWQSLKRTPEFTSTQELINVTKALFNCWSKGQDVPEMTKRQPGLLIIECDQHKETISEHIRDEFRVTAKIYLKSMDPLHIREAVLSTMNYVNVRDLDTVLIAFPPEELERFGVSPLRMRPLWDVLEKFVFENQILRLGVCDFDKDQLAAFYSFVHVKPQINQINLNYSIELPANLNEFAKSHDVQLLVHNDIEEIFPTNTFCKILAKQYTTADGNDWHLPWVVRYLASYKNRAVVRSKGYVFSSERPPQIIPDVVLAKDMIVTETTKPAAAVLP